MKTIIFLFSVLCLLNIGLCFDDTTYLNDFIDQVPPSPLRLPFATPLEAVGDLNIRLDITGDFGGQYGQAPTGNQKTMTLRIVSPTGTVIDLGTYFNGNLLDQPDPDFFPTPDPDYSFIVSGGVTVVNVNDIGYYDVVHEIVLQVPYEIINPITREGGFTVELIFSPAVTPFFQEIADGKTNPVAINMLYLELFYPDGGIIGDPHFYGWNGELFDFHGEPNKIYNAITHKNFNLNLKLKEKEFKSVSSIEDLKALGRNTYIGSIGIQTPTLDIAVHSGGATVEDEAGFVLVNHKMYPIRESGSIISTEEIQMEWKSLGQKSFHKSGQIAGIVSIETPGFVFDIYIIEQGRNMLTNQFSSHPFRFLEIKGSRKNSIVADHIHGLLGQTAPKVDQVSKAIGSIKDKVHFKLEGSNADYEVSHLFGNDFKFNVFHRKN